jgi:hypothetical protein
MALKGGCLHSPRTFWTNLGFLRWSNQGRDRYCTYQQHKQSTYHVTLWHVSVTSQMCTYSHITSNLVHSCHEVLGSPKSLTLFGLSRSIIWKFYVTVSNTNILRSWTIIIYKYSVHNPTENTTSIWCWLWGKKCIFM